MLDRRTLLKFFPLAALVERIIASIRTKPAVVQPLDVRTRLLRGNGGSVGKSLPEPMASEFARIATGKQPPFEVIPVHGVSRLAPIVRVCNDGVNNFVQVILRGHIIATFPYDERSKKRAIGMACNFVRSNSWVVFDFAGAIRTHEELLGPERVAKRHEILKSHFAAIDVLFGGPTV